MPQNIAPPGLIFLLAAALAQQPTKPLVCLLYTSPSPRDAHESRMPSSA